ncbi:glycosyltransferase family 4 protein [Desulfobulbus alkaliphilus]|uniref:glycosyltransferase family 4 protein n=1 Tax=Desulfobulbus alkaliphilus TaxID=869814 RepID=UPI0019655B42|nr:glycosyltransferase family 4 protein [Desulfobulbus alkaliphilus]MBM9538189.1 glycosyltransferase family 4 protein [Desulfobulbus alkaliphilus]
MNMIDVFYLFRETPARRDMLMKILSGQGSGLAGEQLFGFDRLLHKWRVDSNLCFPRHSIFFDQIISLFDRTYSVRAGAGLGDIGAIFSNLKRINRARVVLATSDNTGLAAIRLKKWGLITSPLIYVSVGLPERLKAVASLSLARVDRYRQRLYGVDKILAYGYAEAEWLHTWLGGEVDVQFLPFGVDTEKWTPFHYSGLDEIDVLSIGADEMRDFSLLVEYGRKHPDIRVTLVTTESCSKSLGHVPSNIKILRDLPIDELRILISKARLVVLPVKENSYSGATTTMLQCMAMAKAVTVSRVGAISKGYDLEDGTNIIWMEPGSYRSLENVVDSLLVNNEICKRIGDGARHHVVKHLNWNLYVSRLEQYLTQWVYIQNP